MRTLGVGALLLALVLCGCDLVVGEGEGTPVPPPEPPPEDTVPPPDGTPPPDDTPPPETEPPPGAATRGIWLSREEIAQLPMSGSAWEALREAAQSPTGTPNLSDQDQDNNVLVLAKALVYARTGEEKYRTAVRSQCMAAIDTELDGRTLALGRELAAYVIAADLVGLTPAEEEAFRAWLGRCLREALTDGRTLRSTHEDRPNNWGTHAGASRAAVAVYLGDRAELERTAQVFKGWLGDRSSYSGFEYGELSWQADPAQPVGVNPAEAVKQGESIDGVLPDDMRRGCGFQFPPCETGYVWEALQGATVTAEILHRQGYDAWNWEDRALLRAVRFLHELSRRYPASGWWASGDDAWNVWLVNHAFGSDFPAQSPASSGKNMGWTDWTHAR
jgi:hypothetical protein